MSYINPIHFNISALIEPCRTLFISWFRIYKWVRKYRINQSNNLLQMNFTFVSFKSDEMKREREFYKSRNLPNPKDQPQNNEDDAFDRLNEPHVESDYHRQDEQVNVCLECMTNNLSALKRRFLRCSSQATITHLKKFVAKKVLNGIERYKEVELLCSNWFQNWNLNFVLFSFLFIEFRSIFCVMTNFWAKIIHWNSFISHAGDFVIHHFGCNFGRGLSFKINFAIPLFFFSWLFNLFF